MDGEPVEMCLQYILNVECCAMFAGDVWFFCMNQVA